jgi:CheY-like chemotaxis protein
MEDLELTHKKILIVDDEPDLLEIISSEFDLLGANVYQANSVEKAILVLNNTSIDIVISDVRMPNKTGIDLLKFIKNKNIHSPLTILISGYTDVTMQDIYQLGAEGFLAKPFKLEDLIYSTSRLLKCIGQGWPVYRPSPAPEELVQSMEKSFLEALESGVFSLGRGGCSLNLGHEHKEVLENEEKKFRLQFKDLSLTGSAWIRWQDYKPDSNDQVIGLEFKTLDPESQNVIRHYLSHHEIISYIPCLK